MLKNYLKITLRKMTQQKLLSFINIGGLGLGVACFLLISVYVNHEFSFDSFHKNKENIYRIYRIEDEPSGRLSSAATPHALPKALINDFPDLKNVVSILSTNEDELKAGENKFKEKILFASPNFFEVFDFPFEVGNYKQLTENINSILLTKDLAKKLFGDESPLGKTVTVHGQFNFIVAGILEDIPLNSSFQFDAFVSNEVVYHYMMPDEENKWYSMGVETFVEFSPNLSPENLKAQLPEFLKKYLPDYLQGRLELDLQPLKDIHTDNDIPSFIFPAVSKMSLIMFFLIACTILAIASINFINLAIAGYSKRRKEIGMRKVIGANRRQLVTQFLGESILVTFFAVLIGYALLEIMLPYFNNYIRQPLSFSLFSHFSFFIFALLFMLVLGIINGLYPAILLTSDKPVASLRKEQINILGRIRLRHLLVAVQFGITIVLIFGVISIQKQVSFMENHELGFLSENLVVIPVNTNPTEDADENKIDLFTELIQNEGQSRGVISAANSENVPGSYFPNQFGVIPEGKTESDRIEMVITRKADENFLNTYGMQITSGNNFSKKADENLSRDAVINETAAKMFGWRDPIGNRFKFASSDVYFTVVGVVDDIHFRSLQNKIEPLVFIQCWGRKNFVTAKIRSNDVQNTIAYLREEWSKLMPAFPFEYHFVEDMFKESYKEEQQLLQAVSTFAVLAIVLASLGLLGLTTLLALQRTKEVGIRKTLGASVTSIFILMSKELMLWVVAANVIAQPVAYYFLRHWLQSFPYRIEVNIWLFVISGGTALLIALATVSYQAIKAATSNPVEALKYE